MDIDHARLLQALTKDDGKVSLQCSYPSPCHLSTYRAGRRHIHLHQPGFTFTPSPSFISERRKGEEEGPKAAFITTSEHEYQVMSGLDWTVWTGQCLLSLPLLKSFCDYLYRWCSYLLLRTRACAYYVPNRIERSSLRQTRLSSGQLKSRNGKEWAESCNLTAHDVSEKTQTSLGLRNSDKPTAPEHPVCSVSLRFILCLFVVSARGLLINALCTWILTLLLSPNKLHSHSFVTQSLKPKAWKLRDI